VTKPNERSSDPSLVGQQSPEGAPQATPSGDASTDASGAPGEPPKARYAVDFDLTLESATYFWAGSATNLSKGGFFVATHILQDIGERFRFTIRLPATGRLIKGIGEVRWHRPMDESPEAPAGMGIRFVELEQGSQETIDDYLADREPVRWDAS
jgi:uncharacterized protein (TIGR02266 family)